MNTNAWSHLPNAALIDWVLQSVKDNPNVCAAAHLDVARDATWTAAWVATLDAASDAALNAAWSAASDAARDAAWNGARDAAWVMIAALVAYDDCSEYLSMSYEQLRAWAILSEAPQAVLLLPLKWVQEYEQYNTLTDCTS